MPLAITGVLALVLGIVPNVPFAFLELASDVADAAFGAGATAGGAP